MGGATEARYRERQEAGQSPSERERGRAEGGEGLSQQQHQRLRRCHRAGLCFHLSHLRSEVTGQQAPRMTGTNVRLSHSLSPCGHYSTFWKTTNALQGRKTLGQMQGSVRTGLYLEDEGWNVMEEEYRKSWDGLTWSTEFTAVTAIAPELEDTGREWHLPLLRIMHTSSVLISAVTMSNLTVLDTDDLDMTSSNTIYPISLQVSLTGFLLLEIVLGLSSNLTVLVLYCMKQNLISSVSNIVTMNLHVVDVLVCVGCIPLTVVVLLLPLEVDTAVICCFHEACVSFASVATAANVLAITVDRYDISVRPANRVLTMGRAVALLGSIWALSSLSFLVPFMEVGFFINIGPDLVNQTDVFTVGETNEYHTELGLYYHLLAQIPIFFFTAVVMLVTYYKILQALNIRIGARFQHNIPRKKQKSKNTMSLNTAPQGEPADASQSSTGVRPGGNAPMGMRASVSLIIALRRAVKRHRERRERQRRVFRMSLLIISTFLLCWTPITVLNVIILSTGPSDLTVHLRLGFLVMAYGTTIFHPLLYAFTRQKFQKVLKSKMKKRVVSVVEAEPTPNNVVIHNSWIDPRRNKEVTFEDTEARQKCLCSQDVD